MVAVGLTIAIPLCCAYYPQYSEIALADLEEDLRSKANPRHNYLIYNKGVWAELQQTKSIISIFNF